MHLLRLGKQKSSGGHLPAACIVFGWRYQFYVTSSSIQLQGFWEAVVVAAGLLFIYLFVCYLIPWHNSNDFWIPHLFDSVVPNRPFLQCSVLDTHPRASISLPFQLFFKLLILSCQLSFSLKYLELILFPYWTLGDTHVQILATPHRVNKVEKTKASYLRIFNIVSSFLKGGHSCSKQLSKSPHGIFLSLILFR